MNVRGWLKAIKQEDALLAELRKSERTIADMKIGEVGYTTTWAFNMGYPVWYAACKTMDTAIQRTDDGWKVLCTDPGPRQEREKRERMLQS